MKAPGQLVLGQHVIVGPPLDELLAALLLAALLLAALLLTALLLTALLLAALLLAALLLAALLLAALLLVALLDDELPVPEPPAPVVVPPELLAVVEPLLVVEPDAAVLELFVEVAPGPEVADAALAPPKPPVLSEVSSVEKPFAQATAMTTGLTSQRSFKPRTPVY